MCLDYHNEEKFVLRFEKFYHLRKKKFCIFQGLIQGPLDPKLTTLPLDHGVSSEVRKKTCLVIMQWKSGYGGKL